MTVKIDLNHDATLAITLETAFVRCAQEHGVRLTGIEDDANETLFFWLKVAREIQRRYTITASVRAETGEPTR